MREIRQSGSEGGEVMSLPDPYIDKVTRNRRMPHCRLDLLVGTGFESCAAAASKLTSHPSA